MCVKEREAALFECELSLSDIKVVWCVKGEVVEPSPKYAIMADGKKHSLVVSKCRPKDAGAISCSYPGKLTTEAKLFVEG